MRSLNRKLLPSKADSSSSGAIAAAAVGGADAAVGRKEQLQLRRCRDPAGLPEKQPKPRRRRSSRSLKPPLKL